MHLKRITPLRKSSVVSMHREVLAGFVLQGQTLGAWCRREGILRQWAEKVLKGEVAGPAADKLRERIAKAAGVTFG